MFARTTLVAWFAATCLSAACTQPEDLTSDAHLGETSDPLTGQAGSLSVTTANTVVNQYGVLGANIAAGATSLTITSAADFTATAPFTTALAANDLLLLYQPQGATIDGTDSATFGAVSALNGAGDYELVHVASVTGTTVTLETSCGGTKNAYTTAGLTEVVRVPQATTLTISGTGSITATPWNGARGGVIAVQARSTMTIGGVGIDASGTGFRGGVVDNLTTGPPGTTTIRSNQPATGGEKGESIAGFEALYDFADNGRYGRGAPANGGGGGDAHNAAGGGGANGNNGAVWTGIGIMDTNVTGAVAWKLDPDYVANGNAYTTSSGGGRGGYTFSSSDQDATAVAPGNPLWGGDHRRNVGGLGGRPLANDASARVFLGGGGGAGDGNNNAAGAGGPGGGLVVLLADSVSGTAAVTSNGKVGLNSGNDASGGGGAGGTIVIAARTLTGINARADGAIGGGQSNQNAEAEGAGGGGGGGFIALAGGTITTSNVGALGGTSASTAVTEFPSNGATKGAPGDAVASAANIPICLSDDLSVTNSDGKTTATQGQPTTYTIVVTNNGVDILNGASVVDTFPAMLTNVTWTCTASAGSSCAVASGTGSINTTGTLQPGGTLTYVATGTVSATATGTLTTTVTVATPTGITDPTLANNTATDSDSLPTANLGVTVTANPTPTVAPGANEVYTVTVSNTGPDDAGATTVRDTLPTGATFVSATGTGWSCTQTGNLVTCTATTLAVGTVPVITITTKAPPYGGTASDSVTVTGTTPDPNTANNSASTSTTVTGSADLSVVVTGPANIAVGGTLTYTVTATNNGTGTAGNVTVTDTLPAGATYTSATGTGWTCAQSGQVVTCSAPSLPTGAAPAITIIATAPATPGTITNPVTVASTTPDPNTTNNAGSVMTNVNESADLAVAITAAPEPVTAGAPITYTVDVTNNGPSSASTVTVTDTLPPGATFVSAMGTGWTCTQAALVVTCTAAALPTGAAPAITIVADAPAAGGDATDTVSVSSITGDPVTANNTANVVSSVGASADLGIVITLEPMSPNAGGMLTYTVSVTNSGPSVATTITVTDTLPPGSTFVSAGGMGWTCTQTGQVVTCTAATLPTGLAPDITIVATAPPMGGPFSDSATVSAATPDPTLTNNSTSLTSDASASADLSVTVTSTSPVAIGGTLTYDVTVTNNGPSTANQVVVTETLPDGVKYVSGGGNGWTCTVSGQVVTCTKDAMATGTSSDLTIVTTLTGPASGTLTTSVVVSAATSDPLPANNATSASTVIGADPIRVRGGGLNSGGCDATGGGSSGGMLSVLLVLGALVVRKRRASRQIAVVLTLFAASPVSAQLAGTTQSFPVERMRMALDREGLLNVEWADGLAPWKWNIGTWLGYANDPLTFYNARTGDRAGSLVHNRLGGGLVGEVGITSWLDLGLDLPLIYAQSNQINTEAINSPNSPKLGDLRFIPKLVLRSGRGDRLGIALAVAFSLPSGGSTGYAGDDGATFVPELIISHAFGALRFAGNLEYTARSEKRVLDLDVDDELDLRLGAGYRFEGGRIPWELDLTGSLGTPAAHPYSHINSDPSEVDLGAQFDIRRNITLVAGGGIGIGAGFGSPDWRLFASVRYTTQPAPARQAVVATLPPPPEKIAVVDPDSDGDGIHDSLDKCPQEPEDKDGFEDEDGCPDPDNDKDGVLDVVDKCPLEPGPADNAGCPDPDRDGDGIPDRIDNCPDEKGSLANHGCAAKQLVVINNGKIELVDAVYFRTDKDVIEQRSFGILDNVAKVLSAHPEIANVRVEGHTDNRGGEAHNQELSQRRANAVVKYLAKKGVDKARLVPLGFGQSKPIADNATTEGRATNRRVEFVIVSDAIDVKATGPDSGTIGK